MVHYSTCRTINQRRTVLADESMSDLVYHDKENIHSMIKCLVNLNPSVVGKQNVNVLMGFTHKLAPSVWHIKNVAVRV